MTEEEFIEFFKSDNNPEEEQVKQILNLNKNMKNTTKVTKEKVEGGFELMSGIEIPEDAPRKGKKSPFRKTLEAMSVGQCFDTSELPRYHYATQRQVGIKLRTQQINDNTIRVWRIS